MARVMLDALVQRELKALDLVTVRRAELEARLGAGAIDALRADLTTLGAAVPGQIQARESAKTSTVAQRKALEHAAALVSAIRGSVKIHGAGPAVARAYGVGLRVDTTTPKRVAAAVKSIVSAWEADPARGRALGLLETDIQALTAAAIAAQAADAAQDMLRATAPAATRARNTAAKAVEIAVARICAAGAFQFATDPKLRAQFEALRERTAGQPVTAGGKQP